MCKLNFFSIQIRIYITAICSRRVRIFICRMKIKFWYAIKKITDYTTIWVFIPILKCDYSIFSCQSHIYTPTK